MIIPKCSPEVYRKLNSFASGEPQLNNIDVKYYIQMHTIELSQDSFLNFSK